MQSFPVPQYLVAPEPGTLYLPEVKFYVEKRGSQLVAVAERGRGRGTGADTDIVDLCSSYLEVPFGKLAFYMCSSLTTATRSASIPSGATLEEAMLEEDSY